MIWIVRLVPLYQSPNRRVNSLSHCIFRHKSPKQGGDDKSDPSQSLMKMMKQMYDDGDDEMKRTITKSWYESQEKRKNEGLGSEGMDM